MRLGMVHFCVSLVAMSVFLLSAPNGQSEELSDLLAKVKASEFYNRTVLPFGSCRYSFTTQMFSLETGEMDKELVATLDVDFDGKNQRLFDSDGDRRLWTDDGSLVTFDASGLVEGEEPDEPFHFLARFRDPLGYRVSSHQYDPRHVGFATESEAGTGLPVSLHKILLGAMESDACELTMNRSSAEITFRVIWENQNGWIEYDIDTDRGYSLVGLRRGNLGVQVPYHERHIELTQHKDGFFAKSVDDVRRLPHGDSDEMRLHRKESLRLLHLSDEKPSPDTFSLDSLGIPNGARVAPLSGDKYLWGIEVVGNEAVAASITQYYDETVGEPTKGKSSSSFLSGRLFLLISTTILLLGILAYLFFVPSGGNDPTKPGDSELHQAIDKEP